jgi:hypothetical protein
MTGCSSRAVSMLLWFFGGTMYFFLEVAWKTIGGHPERISWTMLVLAIILSIPLERFGAELPWEMPLPVQALICTAAITIMELAAGLIINVWLGLDVWDYSDLWGNLWGQISLQYSLMWYFLSMAIIPAFDWLRWCIEGGERPHYG